MPSKLFNRVTGLVTLEGGADAVGNYIVFQNGVRQYALTTAITTNVTVTTAPVGSFANTSHATGRGKIFMSDGSKWQDINV